MICPAPFYGNRNSDLDQKITFVLLAHTHTYKHTSIADGAFFDGSTKR